MTEDARPTKTPLPDNVEEVLFSERDSGWPCELPVTLITYPSGKMDLHSQTGPDWDRRIARAAEILRKRGLRLMNHKPEMVGPTGGYMSVTRV